MRPILLKGHERPITQLKFNRDGDLLLTASKDHKPCAWYTNNGERLGTYNGHNGTVWSLDINWTSTRLLTGSSDTSAKLWDVQTGKELASFTHKAMVRSVMFAEGDRQFLTCQDHSFSSQPTIFIYNVADDVKEQDTKPVQELKSDQVKRRMNTALWAPFNEKIITGGDDGFVRIWDVEKGIQTFAIKAHEKSVNNVVFSKDKTMFMTCGADHRAKLWDTKDCKLLKTYESTRPLNAGAISPVMNHVILGGGQDAMNVTTTDTRVGHFEVDFFHTVFMEKLGSVKGHFGPVHTLAFTPNGKSYASGSEDGYVRLHHFDKDYFTTK